MKINTSRLKNRDVHLATGMHMGTPVKIKAISNHSGEIKRIYLRTPQTESKFITKKNGFPKSTFILYSSPSNHEAFISRGVLNGQVVKSELLAYKGRVSPPPQLVQIMTDGHFRMYNNVVLPFVQQLNRDYKSESN